MAVIFLTLAITQLAITQLAVTQLAITQLAVTQLVITQLAVTQPVIAQKVITASMIALVHSENENDFVLSKYLYAVFTVRYRYLPVKMEKNATAASTNLVVSIGF